MGSYRGLYYTLGAIGTGSAVYLLMRRKQLSPPQTPLHGAESCKYILDDSHSHTFSLPDGRKIGYADYGDPNGRPILYQHGLPGSRIEATRYHDLGRELGLRIISIDRPGHGWSSPFEEFGARTVKSWADDVSELVEGLGLKEYAVMVGLLSIAHRYAANHDNNTHYSEFDTYRAYLEVAPTHSHSLTAYPETS